MKKLIPGFVLCLNSLWFKVLQNIELYLKEEELKMVKGYEECKWILNLKTFSNLFRIIWIHLFRESE